MMDLGDKVEALLSISSKITPADVSKTFLLDAVRVCVSIPEDTDGPWAY